MRVPRFRFVLLRDRTDHPRLRWNEYVDIAEGELQVAGYQVTSCTCSLQLFYDRNVCGKITESLHVHVPTTGKINLIFPGEKDIHVDYVVY